MRSWTLPGVLLSCAALGCSAPQRRGSTAAYKDGVIVAGVTGAAGTAAVAAGVAGTAIAVAVGTVVIGAEQFPDPPAGTPPTSTEPRERPNGCRSCRCYKQGIGRNPLGSHRTVDGGGVEEYTRQTCQQDCDRDGYTGFDCTGDKGPTWFK